MAVTSGPKRKRLGANARSTFDREPRLNVDLESPTSTFATVAVANVDLAAGSSFPLGVDESTTSS